MPPTALLRALERLWGIEPRSFQPLTNAILRVNRPQGFRVFEPKPLLAHSGSWAVYLVRRGAIDSIAAARLLAGILGARRYSIQGLKDACAWVFQYFSFKSPRRAPRLVKHGPLAAWLVGWRRDPLRVGGHGFNVFSIDVEVSGAGEPPLVCKAFRSLKWLPGFYGPQRFGVERPNTHYYGLKAVVGAWGDLLREYATRYPMEARRGAGGYEASALRRARREATHTLSAEGLPRIAVEAIQAYIFNRALSKALSLGLRIQELAETRVRVACPQGLREVPAVHLPPKASGSWSTWGRLVGAVIGEEGIPSRGLRMLGARSPARPLAYPVCRLCCRLQGSRLRLHVVLPAGAYATILLRHAGWVDWLSYSSCSTTTGSPSL